MTVKFYNTDSSSETLKATQFEPQKIKSEKSKSERNYFEKGQLIFLCSRVTRRILQKFC